MSRKLLEQHEAAMAKAQSYDEWKAIALAHDRASGAQEWKESDPSRSYDYLSIRNRLDQLRDLRRRRADRELLFTLNEGVHGNLGGMGSSRLYRRAKLGTKALIEDYTEEVAGALEHLADPGTDAISLSEKRDFFRRASHCFGRTALMLSGSGSLFFFHLGVGKALWDQGLIPGIISGSSGGALVGSLMCTTSDEHFEEVFCPHRLAGKEPPQSWLGRFLDAVSPERMTAEDVESLLRKYMPDYTFEEAWRKTGRYMNVSVAPAELMQKSRLLNADTTPNVYLREAVLASAALPGLFAPVGLKARNDRGERCDYLASRKWVDGSLSEDLPAKRLARLYGVNHFIVSQTNPYILPFVDGRKDSAGAWPIVRRAIMSSARTWINTSATLFRGPLSLTPELERLSNSLLSVINQAYSGDITIMPPTKLHNPLKLVAWRSHIEISDMMKMGERATWPHIEQIRIQTRISRTLDGIQKRIEAGNPQPLRPVKRCDQPAAAMDVPA